MSIYFETWISSVKMGPNKYIDLKRIITFPLLLWSAATH